MMVRHWLNVFYVPRTNCGGPGPQLAGGWFEPMCSLMGKRSAKNVAYLSRCNRRAKGAGRQLFEKLARSISPTNAVTRSGRCGQPSRPIAATPQREGCCLTRFSSAGTPWDGHSPSQVMAWQSPKTLWGPKNPDQRQAKILLFLSNYTIKKKIFKAVPPNPPNCKITSRYIDHAGLRPSKMGPM